jgi:hypothetical protein
MRDGLFTMRMSGEERARLERVAKMKGQTSSALIRLWLQREERALAIVQPKPGPVQARRSSAPSLFEQAQKLHKPTYPMPGRTYGDPELSAVVEEDGRRYFVLQTATSVLDTFRISKRGRLRKER